MAFIYITSKWWDGTVARDCVFSFLCGAAQHPVLHRKRLPCSPGVRVLSPALESVQD